MDNNAILITSGWSDKLPENGMFFLQQRLEKIPEDKILSLSYINLKDPIIGLILGVCLGIFGADRFYKGDIGLGIAKLLLCWLTLGIWMLVDLYFVWQGIKKDNLERINMQLMMLGV